ncbi:hypothetical protein EGW08_000933 [Elysia chlorotica]|uniref:Uncharacterized protein n=1 Tax=Elysia chlorotica TaxID=188477 RepID=A0A433UBZ7_ELYCH|nr:hypothetical protein EGW08_000933 [Elysia chlorotica]
MFAYYQTIQVQWSPTAAYDYCAGCLSFKDWIAVQEQNLEEAITENADHFFSIATVEGPRGSLLPSLRGAPDLKFQITEADAPGPSTLKSNYFVRTVFQFFSQSPRRQKKLANEGSDIDEKRSHSQDLMVDSQRENALIQVTSAPYQSQYESDCRTVFGEDASSSRKVSWGALSIATASSIFRTPPNSQRHSYAYLQQ